MNGWLDQLQADLDDLQAQDLLRAVRITEPHGRHIVYNKRRLLNLSSNDYLAISDHPHLQAAAIDAVRQYGTGSRASRLVSGHLSLHERIESRFAQFKQAEAALLLPTGYMANLAVITTLAGKGDLICCDKLNHASLLDAARASGGTVRVYPHRKTVKLARLLASHRQTSTPSTPRPPRRFIVTDGVFSMDGDCADLPKLCDLAEQFDAILIVDDAHGTGVLGERGTGLCELQGVSKRVDIVVSTASKALGGLGGIITARRVVIDTLINRARSFIYTTAPPAAQVAAVGAALDVVRDEPSRRQRVLELAKRFSDALVTMNLNQRHPDDTVTAIVPIVVGSTQAALDLADHLQNHGLFAPAIRPPTVAVGSARVRVSLRADLENKEVDRLCDAVADWAVRKK